MTDTYQTIGEESLGDYREKGSKFLAYAGPAYELEEVKAFLEHVRKEHPKARHHCYAYRLGLDKKKNYRANDDGEPSGSAGLPMLGQIDSMGLSNIVVVVVRYFGGTKLGVPGLINAYKTSTRESLKAATILSKKVMVYYTLSFPYEQMNAIMKIVKRENLRIHQQYFEETCKLDISIRERDSEQFKEQFEKVKQTTVHYSHTA